MMDAAIANGVIARHVGAAPAPTSSRSLQYQNATVGERVAHVTHRGDSAAWLRDARRRLERM